MIMESQGTCPHCGQMQVIRHEEFMTQEEIDKEVEGNCTCEEGQEIRFAKKLERTLKNTLGENCALYGLDYRLGEYAIDFARKAAKMIHMEEVDKVQFVEHGGDTIKLSRSGNDVTITRIHKKQVKM